MRIFNCHFVVVVVVIVVIIIIIVMKNTFAVNMSVCFLHLQVPYVTLIKNMDDKCG
jgi:uncharacterized integral membrane protein